MMRLVLVAMVGLLGSCERHESLPPHLERQIAEALAKRERSQISIIQATPIERGNRPNDICVIYSTPKSRSTGTGRIAIWADGALRDYQHAELACLQEGNSPKAQE